MVLENATGRKQLVLLRANVLGHWPIHANFPPSVIGHASSYTSGLPADVAGILSDRDYRNIY